MSPHETIPKLRSHCDSLAHIVTQMHPEVRALGHPPTQAEILRALFELTRQVEVVKKHLIKLEKNDSSTLL